MRRAAIGGRSTGHHPPGRLACALAALVMVFVAPRSFGQTKPIDYNSLYKFLASVGVEYHYLSPASDYGTDITSFYDLSAVARIPIPPLPSLQPFVRLGMTRLITPERDGQEKWRHTDWYGLLGLSYASRFSKNFEIGVELGGGFAEAIFPALDPSGPRGSPTLLASAGVHIGLDPSYNVNIDVHPQVRFTHALTPLTRFNGFVLGIGLSASYRFGEDPDAPQAVIRELKLDKLAAEPVFAAMQFRYKDKPFATATITNVGRYPVTDIQLSFFQSEFMDSPTQLSFPTELAPGESAPVSITATFNGKVFTTQGVMPLTGQVVAEYSRRGKTAKQSFSIPYDLQDKNAITWDDDRKVGAFITPRDKALTNFTGFVVKAAKAETTTGLSQNLQLAVQIFYALKELGLVYKSDPTSAFTQMQGNPQAIDSISLARDTLKLGAGDCDDLTVLYSSLLESLGIPTGVITTPGHIFPMFDTGVPPREFALLHPDQSMAISLGGTLWVPVEVTTVREGDFLAAWRLGIEEYKALDAAPGERKIYRTADSQQQYPPVGLLETDLGLEYPSRAAIAEDVRTARERIIDLIVGAYEAAATKSRSKRDLNRLGVICAQFGRYAQAQKALSDALSLDRNAVEPLVNLGNVFYLKGEYQNALRNYVRAQELLGELGRAESQLAGRLLLDIALAYYELENYDQASAYFERASAIDPALSDTHAHLRVSPGTGRAAAVSTLAQPLYAEEE